MRIGYYKSHYYNGEKDIDWKDTIKLIDVIAITESINWKPIPVHVITRVDLIETYIIFYIIVLFKNLWKLLV